MTNIVSVILGTSLLMMGLGVFFKGIGFEDAGATLERWGGRGVVAIIITMIIYYWVRA